MNWKINLLIVAEVIDSFRVVPRVILALYGVLVWQIVDWYMLLPEPSTQHAALVTIVVGVIAPVVGLYQNSGRSWQQKQKSEDK